VFNIEVSIVDFIIRCVAVVGFFITVFMQLYDLNRTWVYDLKKDKWVHIKIVDVEKFYEEQRDK
jgi:hypothetical protein